MLAALLAAGFFYPDLGATQMGRGATGVAAPGDLAAFAYNPAGLAALQGIQVDLQGSLAAQGVDFLRAGAANASSNTAGAFANGLGGASWQVSDRVVIAASVYGPPAVGRAEYAPGGAQRYSVISSSYVIVYPGLGVGVKATDWLDLGAVVQLRYFHETQSQAIYAVGNVTGELQDLDSTVTADSKDPARLVFGVGAIARPFEGFSVGASFRPGVKVAATGTLDVALGPVAQASGATTTGRSANIDFQLPPEARLGLKYEREKLALYLDGVWENWGVTKSIVVSPQDVVIHAAGQDTRVGAIEIPRDWHAAWSARLGGEYQLARTTLRLGALYETSAIPDETLQPDFVTPSRFALTAGATARWGKLALTLSAMHFFQSQRDVTNSIVTRVDPFPAPADVIGNGRYNSSLDVFALQISAAL